MIRALNKLTKWRVVFAGWQLGTRADNDPECRAVRDHRDATMVLRVEVTALTRLLIEKKIITADEFSDTVTIEAAELEKMYERKFPGFRAVDEGMSIDPQVAAKTMKGWRS
jgi:hypothetical protein